MNGWSSGRSVGPITRHLKLVAVALLLIPTTAAMPVQVAASNTHVPAAKQEPLRFATHSNAKHALALELTQWSNGQISTAKFNHDLSAFVLRWGSSTFASQQLSTLLSSGAGPSKLSSQPLDLALLGISPSKNLGVSQFPELNPGAYCQPGFTCYCGPAAAESVLQYLQPTSHDSETLIQSGSYSPGQYGLAGIWGSGSPYSTKYLETNVQGGETPWYSGSNDWPMNQSFNYWMSGDYFGYPYYAHYAPTSVSDYETELTADIWNGGLYTTGFPLAADIEEVQYGLHLPGHPTNVEIEHWIGLYGYTSSGAGTSYVDPAAGSALNWNVAAYNPGYDSSNIYTLVTDVGTLGPYGIVW
jgi:hypothetical protein